jgi:small-conductance mechanosensitive channel
LHSFFELTGPEHSITFLGVRLVGLNAANAKKILFSIIFVAAVILIGRVLRWVARRGEPAGSARTAFWTRQGISIAVTTLTVVGLLSIWFNNPTQLTTALGLFTAGLAFALQQVVLALAGYFVILRGKTFNVGDRITMGGVRGDVMSLNFLQTVIMEMGEPPAVQSAPPAMWVEARQYTGRIVSISNAKIFDQPVYNYTREFPYIWEEMRVPISYNSEWRKAEKIIMEAAERHTVKSSELSESALRELERRYFIRRSEIKPATYIRLTDNWIEMAVRFVVEDHGIRETKNRISRDILEGLSREKIGIASGTYEIVGMPPIRVQMLDGQTKLNQSE